MCKRIKIDEIRTIEIEIAHQNDEEVTILKNILPLFTAFMLFGCAQNKESSLGPENNRHNSQPYKVNVENDQIRDEQRLSIQQASNRLAETAKSMPGVKNATAVSAGDYAIVGIDVDANLDRSEVGSIKYTVAEALRSQPNGANALVIADPDLYARIQEIKVDINNGRPLQGLANELADIAGRTIPEVPGNLTETNDADKVTEQPKTKLAPNGDRQLEQQQEEQSNHQK
ncbi:YhcN/YlaJ family sporulation lipoprotein [Bacillus sp. REN10]|uniref:YhcN/YlaJ family sporulation lipoprotein n=1 Tax=Bacillus sp. REN10 TaxID=2782541 RepID=UPI00193B1589|nr:YhcN/YlaJ family sporulation lipoprotein [Bacillus sp. REN10]